MSVTSETTAEAAALRTKCFDLGTRIAILELDLSRSRSNAEHYRRLWNAATNELAKLRKQVAVLAAHQRSSPKTRKVRPEP